MGDDQDDDSEWPIVVRTCTCSDTTTKTNGQDERKREGERQRKRKKKKRRGKRTKSKRKAARFASTNRKLASECETEKKRTILLDEVMKMFCGIESSSACRVCAVYVRIGNGRADHEPCGGGHDCL